ncbi:unnamed protein product [Sympodiomycopsis kandeliae]
MSDDEGGPSASPTSNALEAFGTTVIGKRIYKHGLKPGEESLPPAEQEKLLKRRARDRARYHKKAAEAAMVKAASTAADADMIDGPLAAASEDEEMEDGDDVDIEATNLAPPQSTRTVSADRDQNGHDSSDESSEDEDDKLHCLCQTKYTGDRIMMCCDRCDGWYHPECLKMKESDAKLVDMLICPRCALHTSDRTTWKTACLRPSCIEPANPPLSRYCSDRCGILVAAARIAKTKYAKGPDGIERLMGRQVKAARKKEGMVVWQNDHESHKAMHGDFLITTWFQQFTDKAGSDSEDDASLSQDMSDQVLTSTSSKEEEILNSMKTDLRSLLRQKSRHSSALDLAMARNKLLQLTEDRLGTLPPLTVSEDTGTGGKKGKGSKGSGAAKSKGDDQVRTQPRCGYDERLSWDDQKFTEWMISEHGKQVLDESIPLDGLIHEDGVVIASSSEVVMETTSTGSWVCGISKRKCKRHLDWSTTRNMDFEAERESQTAILSRIAEQETHLRSSLTEVQATLQAKRTAEDARIAMMLAEGTAARRRGGG